MPLNPPQHIRPGQFPSNEQRRFRRRRAVLLRALWLLTFAAAALAVPAIIAAGR